jgi:signal peptidase I
MPALGEVTDTDAADPPREPWLGANLSLFFPGLGRWYAGDRAVALVEIAIGLALLGVGGSMTFAPDGNAMIGMALLGVAIVYWAFGVWDAHRACRARASAEVDAARRQRRDAWKAVFLSRLFPGLGQIYDRRLPIGIVLALAALLIPRPNSLGWGIANGLVGGGAVLDAALASRGRRPPSARVTSGILGLIALVAVLGQVAVGAFREFGVRAFRTPSASMAPTLEPGDRIFVQMWAKHRARVGDIVLLPFGAGRGQVFVKTVFAVPGDEVEFRADGAYRNGEQAIAVPTPDAALAGVVCGRPGAPFRVPEGSVFVLGDNYLNSNDSRFLGAFKIADVRGRAYKIYWPPARAGALAPHRATPGTILACSSD